MAKLIEMPFALVTQVGCKYHVLYGDPIPQEKGTISGWTDEPL